MSIKKISYYRKGQALIELLIALGLLSLTFTTTSRLFIDVSYGDLIGSQRVKAEGLAQEGIEALKSIHERSWDNLTNGITFPAHPVIESGIWNLESGNENIDIYSREIVVNDAQRDSNGQIVASGGSIDPSTKRFIARISWNSPRSLSLEKEIYLSRWRGNQVDKEDGVGDFVHGTLVDTVITNESGGEVRLDVGEGFGGFKGNRFSTLTNDSVGNLDHEDKKVSFRFTAQYTGDVDYIRIYINDNHPTQPPKYRFGLQSDLNGFPSGVWLGENNDAYKDYRIRDLGWKQLELEHDAEIVEGTAYHLVVEYHSEQINPAKYIDLRALYPLNQIVPFSGQPDPNRMILWSEDGGTTWTEINKSPVFILIPEEDEQIIYDNAEGNPYYTAYDADIWGTNYKGQIFTYTEETENFNRLGTYVYLKHQSGATPQDDLYFQIRDLTAGEDLIPPEDRVFIIRDQASVDYQLKEKTFASPLTLTQNHQYRLYFYSPNTAQNRAYQIGAGENIDQAPDNNINYLGSSSRYSQSADSGGNWQDYNNIDVFYQFSVIAEGGHFSYGQYTSDSFDAGSEVSFNRIFWSSQIPQGTELKLQIAINSDNTTWNFVGPDGTNSTYFTPSSSQAINLANIIGRYFKYKAYFSTTIGDLSPVLENFSVNYSQ